MTDPTTPSAPEPTPPTAGSASYSPGAPSAAPYSTGSTPAKSPVLSIISLISGILGFLAGFIGWGLLFSIAAVVLGHLGQKRETHAKGFWLTGLITGYVGIALNLIVLTLAIIAFATLANYGGY